ncbi:MAG: hypothetical protein QOE64_83 [Frankiales bacterium]|nr:hypothetical protein [Frankiales bacterium]
MLADLRRFPRLTAVLYGAGIGLLMGQGVGYWAFRQQQPGRCVVYRADFRHGCAHPHPAPWVWIGGAVGAVVLALLVFFVHRGRSRPTVQGEP